MISAVVVVIGALAVPKITPLWSSGNTTDNNTGSSDLLNVDGYTVRSEQVNNTYFTSGTIRANEEVELRSEVSGKITDIYFEEGKPVEKDQLLVKINDSELQAQLNRVKYRLELAKTREDRQKKLLEKGGISQGDYDATLNELNVLKAEAELIRAQIDKTEIRAPFDGIIGLKYVSDGSYISPSTRIAALQSINPVKIDFSVPEKYAAYVDEGDSINFTVQGYDDTFHGAIYAVEPKIETQTRTLQIRAKSPNKAGKLLPGAFADIDLILEQLDEALMIPTMALVPELQGQKVFIYQNGKVENRSVTTGIRTEKSVQVLDGLTPGDTILTTGLLQVRPGMQVNMTEIN